MNRIVNILKKINANIGIVFSIDFLFIWFATFLAAFTYGLRWQPELEANIIEYISIKIGYQLTSLGLHWLLIGIVYFIFFTLIASNRFSFSDIINKFKNKSHTPDPSTLYQKHPKKK